MRTRISTFASLLAAAVLAVAPAAHAKDIEPNSIEREVPALRDGSRIALAEVESVILDACARQKFRATVVEPGVITARYGRLGKSVEVTIPYSEEAFSVQRQERRRNNAAHDERLIDLIELIEADLERQQLRLNSYLKPLRRAGRINPRTAA